MSAEQTSPSVLQTSTAKRRFDPRRILPALVFIPICYGVVRYAPPIVFFGFVCASALLALRELYRLRFTPQPAWLETLAGATATVLLLISVQWPELVSVPTALALTIVALPVVRLCSTRELRHTLGDLATLYFGLLYVGFTLGHFLPLRALPDGVFLVFFVLFVTWAGDTGAYVFGLHFGSRPLAPAISPKKTVEGLIGGVVLAMLAALVARAWFLPAFTLPEAAAVGVGLGVIGALGDLVESALKRSAGVKDSGSLIPGHGGMLDRIDSLLFTTPALYYYLVLVHA